jgi:rare lipoprotein A
MKFNFISIFLCTTFSMFLNPCLSQNEICKASYYHSKFEGRGTSNGEIFRNKKYTAAHKTLAFGTWVKLTNLKNDSVCFVRINDRLPQSSKRCIDLSQAAAGQLNMLKAGVIQVKFEIVEASLVPEKFNSSIELKKKK